MTLKDTSQPEIVAARIVAVTGKTVKVVTEDGQTLRIQKIPAGSNNACFTKGYLASRNLDPRQPAAETAVPLRLADRTGTSSGNKQLRFSNDCHSIIGSTQSVIK